MIGNFTLKKEFPIFPSTSPKCFFAIEIISFLLPAAAAKPKLDINFLSCCKSFLAISHPAFSLPTILSLGTSTSSKNVSQKGDLPLISVIGFVETPLFPYQ